MGRTATRIRSQRCPGKTSSEKSRPNLQWKLPSIKNISIEKARRVDLPHWINTRIKDNMRTLTILHENKMNVKEKSVKDSPYKKISRKKPCVAQDTSESSKSHENC